MACLLESMSQTYFFFFPTTSCIAFDNSPKVNGFWRNPSHPRLRISFTGCASSPIAPFDAGRYRKKVMPFLLCEGEGVTQCDLGLYKKSSASWSQIASCIRPWLLTEGNTTKVCNKNFGQTKLRGGSSQHRVTYWTDSYEGIGAAFDSVLNVFLLNINGQLSVCLDNWCGAADSVQSLISPGWSLSPDELEDLVQERILFW